MSTAKEAPNLQTLLAGTNKQTNKQRKKKKERNLNAKMKNTFFVQKTFGSN